MPLTFKLASRNLLQDRLRFIGTLVGIVFAMVLVTIQLGLFLSFERMVSTMIDHASADLWIVPAGTKCFEDPSLLDAHDRTLAQSVPGVADATPVIIGFNQWSVPGGGTTPVFMVGSEVNDRGLHPWNLVAGNPDSLTRPHAVAVDQTYFARLGIKGVGDSTEIREQPVEVTAVTDGIRSFTTTPYVFATLEHARAYVGLPAGRISYLLVHVAPGSDVAGVRDRLLGRLAKVEILTPAEFRARSRNFWLFGTGAGAALFAGALLGAIVGTVIVAQTLYSSTKDHLSEFATLRAIGSSSGYINKVIICQALISAVIGFGVAAGIGLIIVLTTARTALPIMMTPQLTLALFGLTVLMCVTSAIAAIVQVLRIDPAVAFPAMNDPLFQTMPRPGRSGSGEPLIEAVDIVQRLGKGAGQVEALKGVSLTLTGGELTLLMGPSGSGKTTLLSVLGCMLTPTDGTVRIRGQSTAGARPGELARLRREHIGFIFQAYRLFPTLTALDNVRLALDVRGEPSEPAIAQSRTVLRTVGLEHKANAFPSELSGGEQQRVAIARAIVGNPTAILADEPTGALDSENGLAIMRILADIARNESHGVLVVTHDPRVMPFADRIIHIEDGRISQDEARRFTLSRIGAWA